MPLVALQEIGLADKRWAAEAGAAAMKRGWRIAVARSKKTQKGGLSAGTALAVPSAVAMRQVPGQKEWDCSPRGLEGRIAAAVV